MERQPADYLADIEELARESGKILMKHFRQLEGYELKGESDIVTVADRESEDFLQRELLRRFPDHGILGEEGGRYGNPDSEFQWIVDPLDGTNNYAHGLIIFAVSIGLVRNGKPIAGGIYAPVLDEMYLAAEGNGATRNGRPIRVSSTGNLRDGLVVTGFPYQRAEHVEILKGMLGQALLDAQGVLRLGSAAYDFCNVAAGHLEGFYEHGLSPWDMAAGVLIVEEAGGRVTGMLEGEKFDLFNRRVVATNAHIHGALLATLKKGGVEGFGRP